MNTKEFIIKARKIHGSEYDYPGEYVSMKKPIEILCHTHGLFTTTPATHLYCKSKCPRCSVEKRSLTTEKFISSSRKKHGDTYDYSKVEYINSTTDVEIICKIHGSFFQTPKSHKRGRGCRLCNGGGHTKKTTEDFIKEANIIHNGYYDYSTVKYMGARKKVTISCKEHGIFQQTPDNHLRGSGCPTCSKEKQSSDSRIYTTESFIKNASDVHDNKYDYSLVNYTNCDSKVSIICPTHGEFTQIPYSHIRGMGCHKCGSIITAEKKRYSNEEFITKSNTIHKNKYDYSEVEYNSSKDKVKIICPEHGAFYQNAGSHMCGCGCPGCFSAGSKAELEILEFIKSFGVDAYKTREIIAPLELDIFIPSLNMAIEYCGLYWHSEANNKKQNYHANKHKMCEEKGIRLITIFEDEWNTKREIVKSALIHFIGKSKKGCFARNSTIREIPWTVARDFLNKHHLMGAGHPGNKRIGAFDKEDNLIGVMVYGAPSDERGATDVIEMKRFVTDKANHPGLGSKMFKWAVTNYNYSSVIAFVDRRWFTGNFKIHSGFKIISTTNPAMYWTDFTNRYHRRVLTKKDISAREQFRGRELTKPQMMRELGYSRIWDCGKLKLQWTVS